MLRITALPCLTDWPPSVCLFQNMYSETVSETKRHYQRDVSPPREYRTPAGGNLQELDTLLYDLNEARYNGSYIQQRPTGEAVQMHPAAAHR